MTSENYFVYMSDSHRLLSITSVIPVEIYVGNVMFCCIHLLTINVPCNMWYMKEEKYCLGSVVKQTRKHSVHAAWNEMET
jgi:hypothetical protein